MPLAPDVNPSALSPAARPAFSGADLANLVNEAALLAARRNKRLVAMQEFEDAKDKVMMGSERKSMVMTEDEKKMTAYHEAGHAIVAIHEPASDPIHKATIIPRGRALGMVMRLPERDSYSYHRDKMHANLAVSMGGRVAEEIIFGYDKVSSGASSDIQYATKLARDMVTQWGMSDEMGPLQYEEPQGETFLGYSQSQRGSTCRTKRPRRSTSRNPPHRRFGQLRTRQVTAQEASITTSCTSWPTRCWNMKRMSGDEIKELLTTGKFHRDDGEIVRPSATPQPGTAIPRAGGKRKRNPFGDASPAGA